jgi:RhtX/FptX family siderophore transporter
MMRERPIVFKLVVLGGLYFAQGLPYGFLTQVLPAVMREQGLGLGRIGLANLVVLPWALKFLWAPMVDGWQSGPLGPRRSWILPIQILSSLLLLVLAGWEPGRFWLPTLLLVGAVNLLSASQDIASDGLAVDCLSEGQRGWGNGVQVGAFRLGMMLGGGVLLLYFEQLQWRGCLLLLALLSLLGSSPLLWARERAPAPPRHRSPATTLLLPFRSHPAGPALLLLVISYKFSDAMGASLIRPMLVDLGYSLRDLGFLLGLIGFGGALAGALVAGGLMDRLGRPRALFFFGLLQALTLLAYAWLSTRTELARAVVQGLFLLEHFCGSMATTALFTVMMDHCRADFAASDYTTLASAVVVSTVAAGVLAGSLAEAHGYTALFLASSALTMVALPLALFLLGRIAAQVSSGDRATS